MPLPVTPVATIPQVFTFTLDSVNILNTRSEKTDTDFVSFTLRVAPKGSQGTPMTLTKRMGDLGPGIHPINLTFNNVKIGPTDDVILNYLIVNAGHVDPTKAETAVQTAGHQASMTGQVFHDLTHFNALGTTIDIMRGIVSLLADLWGGIFDGPNCDGTVAAMQELVPWANLQKAGNNALTESTTHPGSDSPHGCGKNSAYQVFWHAKLVPMTISQH